MTGRVFSKYSWCGFQHFEEPWPKAEQCDWCFTERFKNKARLRVQISDNEAGRMHVQLCLPCWFLLAFKTK